MDHGPVVGGCRTILGSVNFITMIICMRAPGMTMFRMPIFVWNVLITSLLALPFQVLAGALLMPELTAHSVVTSTTPLMAARSWGNT
jgi:cytochrome c oxidase subunit 1